MTQINTLTQPPLPQIDETGHEGSLGERYFVARIGHGVCVVNYEPLADSYLGGPFITWDGARAFVGARRRKRLFAALLSAGAIALGISLLAALAGFFST